MVERGGGWSFYSGIKKVAAVVIKSSVYACFKMFWSMVYFHSNQIFFLLVCKCPPLFWFIFGLFLFQSLGFRGFQRD